MSSLSAETEQRVRKVFVVMMMAQTVINLPMIALCLHTWSRGSAVPMYLASGWVAEGVAAVAVFAALMRRITKPKVA